MNYRQEIQGIVEDLEKIYARTDTLRDHAFDQEKVNWNFLRYHLQHGIQTLNNLDNKLSEARALLRIKQSS